MDLSGGEPRPVTPEGIVSVRGSGREGAVIGAAADATLAHYPLHGGDPHPMVARLPPGAIPLRVSGDGRLLFMGRERIAVPYRVDRLELATGTGSELSYLVAAVAPPCALAADVVPEPRFCGADAAMQSPRARRSVGEAEADRW